MEYPHQPVLVQEVLETLCHNPDGIYVDGTAGSAGHSEEIAKRLSEKGHLICLDRDPEAVRFCEKRLAFLGSRISVVKASYADLDEVVGNLGFQTLDGVLLDLGMSSYQLDDSGRGFSFSRDEPLDMRMDPDEEGSAHDIVNCLPKQDLEKILRIYGEEKNARRIAGAIVREREKHPIETSFQLADIIQKALPAAKRFKAKHPATQTFQALRVSVNRELQNLGTFLDKIPFLISPKGRLVVLSYHSLEDRMVKSALTNWEKDCICPPDFPQCACGKIPLFRRLLRKGLRATQEEIESNPRARSAVMRAAERI